MKKAFLNLPGAELIDRGLKDLEKSLITISSLLICIGKPRLENAGLKIPKINFNFSKDAELMLYELIVKEGHPDPYSYYNSLLRRLISFEQAIEHRV